MDKVTLLLRMAEHKRRTMSIQAVQEETVAKFIACVKSGDSEGADKARFELTVLLDQLLDELSVLITLEKVYHNS